MAKVKKKRHYVYPEYRIAVTPSNLNVLDPETLAFVTRNARENIYKPENDPVLKRFRKQLGFYGS